jgi:ADP-heptose:LPS heptosyltransferase
MSSKADHFAARVLRGGLFGVKRITDIFRKPATEIPEAPEKILLLKLWGLGELVLSTPSLLAIRKKFPQAEITLLTTRPLMPLYEDAGLFDKTVVWEDAQVRELPARLRAFRREMRENNYDLALNFQPLSNLAALLTYFSGAAATVGFLPPGGSKRDYTLSVPFNAEVPVREAFYDLARVVFCEGEPAPPVSPKLKVTELQQATATLHNWGVDKHTYLVGVNINPRPQSPFTTWPAEKFVLLAQAIEEIGEYKTVFFGTREEERFVSRHVKTMQTKPINLSGRTSIRQLAALLTRMQLVVSANSGTLQLAAALGVPTVGVFGDEPPLRYAPEITERHEIVWRETAESLEQDLSLDEVRVAVSDMLDHLSDPEQPPWLEES